MKQEEKFDFDNYDDENIADIEAKWKEKRKKRQASNAAPKKVFTLVQENSNSEVVITASSCEKCAQALLR